MNSQIITAEHLSHVLVTSLTFEAYITVRAYDDGLITAQAVNEDGLHTPRRRNPGTRLVHTDSITKPVVMAFVDEFLTYDAAARVLSTLVVEHMEHRAKRTEGLYSALMRSLNEKPY